MPHEGIGSFPRPLPPAPLDGAQRPRRASDMLDRWDRARKAADETVAGASRLPLGAGRRRTAVDGSPALDPRVCVAPTVEAWQHLSGAQAASMDEAPSGARDGTAHWVCTISSVIR